MDGFALKSELLQDDFDRQREQPAAENRN